MAETLRHFRIFISSPGDVSEERELVLKVIDNIAYDPAWKERVTLEAVAWDKKGAPLLARMTPQEAVNLGLPLPSECDIVVVIFWARMGTPLPFPEYRKEKGEQYLSGTEWEYEDAIKSAKATTYPEVIVYRRTEVPSWPPTDSDIMKKIEQWQQVQTFFSRFSEEGTGAGIGGYNSYANASDFEDLLETHLKYVLERLLKSFPRPPKIQKIELEPIDKNPVWQGSPFPGLRAFTTADEQIYFGRGRETTALMRRVAARGFVAVVGASGSGKSSLVGAGLIPKLKAGGLDGSASWILPEFKDGQWVGLRFTPGEVSDNPFTALAVKCAPMHGLKPAKLAEQVEADPKALRDLCLKALAGKPDPAKVLIFIDQFEELFTVVAEKYREPFIKMLAEAAAEPRLRVVVTTRSDFYDRCVEWQVLTDLLENGSFPLSTPDAFFLKDMIELPAERAGLTFEEGLPAQMVRDTGSDAGALALLAFALDELYKAGELTQVAYEKLGKVEGAIGTRAAAIYNDLEPEVQAALPEVFAKLVTVTVEGIPTRRRAALSEFPVNSASRQLISALVEARLLVSDKDSVEVAHEALFRKWPTLAEWIAEYKNDLYVIEQVKQAAREWEASGKRASYLWSHDRLKPVYEAQKRLNTQFDVRTEVFIQPEAKRLLEEFRTASVHKRLTLIEEDFERLGEDGLEELVSILEIIGHDSYDDYKIINTIYEIFYKNRSKASLALIGRLHNDDWIVQQLVFDTLMRLNTQETIPAIIPLLSEENMRHLVLKELVRLNVREAIPAIISLLSSDHRDVHQTAVKALATLNAQEAIPTLIPMISSSNRDVRQTVIQALVTLNAREAIPTLIPMISSSNRELQQTIIQALATLNAREAIPTLIPMISSSNRELQQTVIQALATLNAQEAIPILIPMISNSNRELQQTVIKALVALNAQEAIPILIPMISSSNRELQQTVIKALVILNAQEAVSSIIPLLSHPDKRMRRLALDTLVKLNAREAISSLIKILIGGDKTMGQSVAIALGMLNAVEAIPSLIGVLLEVNSELQWLVIMALEQIGTPEALAAVADWRTKHPEE